MDDCTSTRFQQIFREHYPVVVRKIMQLVNSRTLAEELAQEVFLRLYRSPPDDSNRVGAWLHRVLTNVSYDYLRKVARQRDLEQQALDDQPPDGGVYPSNEQLYLNEFEKKLVHHVLEQLDERDRKALLLKHSGYSYQEISELLAVKPDNVGTILLRATARFKRHYQREETLFNEESLVQPQSPSGTR